MRYINGTAAWILATDVYKRQLLLYCVVIITLVKRVKVEVYDRLCIPDTKCVYNIVVITCDRHIVRNSLCLLYTSRCV